MLGRTDKKHLDGHDHLKPETSVGVQPDQWLAASAHRPKVGDQHPTQDQSGDRPHNPINGLAACKGPHLKAPVLNNSYLAPVHRARQGLLAL